MTDTDIQVQFKFDPGYTYTDDPTYVYALLDPRTGEARYVGASIDPVTRAKQHMHLDSYCENPKKPNAKRRWINELKSKKMRPELAILEEVTGSCQAVGKQHPAAKEAEQGWIVKLAQEGHRLTNGRLPDELKVTSEDEFQAAFERGRQLLGEQ